MARTGFVRLSCRIPCYRHGILTKPSHARSNHQLITNASAHGRQHAAIIAHLIHVASRRLPTYDSGQTLSNPTPRMRPLAYPREPAPSRRECPSPASARTAASSRCRGRPCPRRADTGARRRRAVLNGPTPAAGPGVDGGWRLARVACSPATASASRWCVCSPFLRVLEAADLLGPDAPRGRRGGLPSLHLALSQSSSQPVAATCALEGSRQARGAGNIDYDDGGGDGGTSAQYTRCDEQAERAAGGAEQTNTTPPTPPPTSPAQDGSPAQAGAYPLPGACPCWQTPEQNDSLTVAAHRQRPPRVPRLRRQRDPRVALRPRRARYSV